ncbi:hypothetical protein M8C21_028097 [Ambrosia artemisiifolia]|uniref:Flavin-containing monooxygenase n=1 Tax=Ambrosia artemisiifolia TaxID=4212 RepID=A0AAD5BX59_AMBAR|nr:hypothetical protein M8C21_028097 [Ambrosia artemisiifolia]
MAEVIFSKIGIIGGGISGLAAAKELAQYEPVVLEATDSIGGVWKHCSFRTTKLQTPRCDYEFSDFPWPLRDNSSFPSYAEILDYLSSYATHFDLFKFIKFNSRVTQIRLATDQPHDKPLWEVAAVQTINGSTLVQSAIDLALECAQANQGEEGKSCTMVVRTSHWIVPHYSIWGLPFYLFYSTRFSQFLHQRPNQGALRNLLCLLLSPARKATSKLIESYLLWKLPLVKYGLKPDHPFEEDYASCQMAILPDTFFSEADKGKINFKRASSWWFSEGGVEFDDNTKLEADLVILATGYDGKKKIRDVLPQPFCSFLEFPSSGGMMPLYRGTINPYIPNMAFMGYVESVSNLHTSEIRCKWLARLIGGKFKLPSMEKMVEQIQTEAEIMKKTTRFYKRTCISTFSINHSDEICQEMGWTSWRKKTWLAEAFSPYNSRDYQQQDTAAN